MRINRFLNFGGATRASALRAAAFSAATLLFVVACADEKQFTPWKTPTRGVLEHGNEKVIFAQQTAAIADAKSVGCVKCHEGSHDPHPTPQNISCVDCHGGNGQSEDIRVAHVFPAQEHRWPLREDGIPVSANPQISYMGWIQEDWNYVRFVNPGDLRVARVTCAPCHSTEVLNVSKSIMTTSAHLWNVAAYANGILSDKRGILGESYSPEGIPQLVSTVPPPTDEEYARGVAAVLVPLPNFEISQTGNIFRVFEQGSRLGGPALGFNGAPLPPIGIPEKLEDPGKPNNRLSDRGFGTLLRIDLAVLNVHKTRLNDPHLSLLGTNDNPGDYRSSGCTACHVVYANDRTVNHSGHYAKSGHEGYTEINDKAIDLVANKGPNGRESGHPIKHEFTSAIPSSQCMVCHMHQPNSFVNSYYGYTMWSYETDGEEMWPKVRENVPHDELIKRLNHNPEEAAVWGKWHDQEFLRNTVEVNKNNKHTQFADYHGHGWIFRAAFKMDRHGNLLDANDQIVPYDDPNKFKGLIEIEGTKSDWHTKAAANAGRRAVHLQDIHAAMGMHCVDCHFEIDVHGDGKLYTAYQNQVSVRCLDCHGTVYKKANLTLTGPSSATYEEADRRAKMQGQTPFRRKNADGSRGERIPRFEENDNGEIIQNSMVDDGKSWVVKQVYDSVQVGGPKYNPKAAYAKTVRRDGTSWGALPENPADLAHGCDNDPSSKLECYTCHTSWITACFGCHLPQRANWKSTSHHFTDEKNLRQYSSYNPQAVRDSEFMLGVAGNSKGNRIAPVRSSSALLLSSEDGTRQKTYAQLPPIAANGMSSQLFNTHFPHTVRTKETRKCDDCHVSANEDNNAWLAQTYLLGTNYVNFVGLNAFIGAGTSGIRAVRVTEYDEPQAVYGSYLHKLAYPQDYEKFVHHGRELHQHEEHAATDARSVQLIGEYLFVASGAGGFKAYDVANVNNKGFSEKIVTAPVSPLGQDIQVSTEFATAVAVATTNRVTMSRVFRSSHPGNKLPINQDNGETPYFYKGQVQNLHETYRYAYVSDFYEGLVVIDVDCLQDGDPLNNFLERVATFNPNGILNGAVNVTIAGQTAYICCDAGIVVLDIDDPREPKVLTTIGAPHVVKPTSIAVQFRYAFVTDAEGLKVIDITTPSAAAPVAGAVTKIADARDVYVARTYAYVSAGAEGLVIVDVERPSSPKVDQIFNAGGRINDLCQVKVGMTNDSVFAYLADGKNGMHVLQLISPGDNQPRSPYGFSPRPSPEWIATFPMEHGRALAVSKGLDRDRAVDESGNQMAAFGRIGSRPLNLQEMQKLYMRNGQVYRVTNEPVTEPLK